MTCQECEIKLGMGEDAGEHLEGCAECRGIESELRLNSVALLGMRAEFKKQTAGPGGPARTRASAPLLAIAAAIVMAIFLRAPRVERLPMRPIALQMAGHGPAPQQAVLAKHVPALHRKARRRLVPAETLRVKMFTSDPDVVIYWIVDKKEGYE